MPVNLIALRLGQIILKTLLVSTFYFFSLDYRLGYDCPDDRITRHINYTIEFPFTKFYVASGSCNDMEDETTIIFPTVIASKIIFLYYVIGFSTIHYLVSILYYFKNQDYKKNNLIVIDMIFSFIFCIFWCLICSNSYIEFPKFKDSVSPYMVRKKIPVCVVNNLDCFESFQAFPIDCFIVIQLYLLTFCCSIFSGISVCLIFKKYQDDKHKKDAK